MLRFRWSLSPLLVVLGLASFGCGADHLSPEGGEVVNEGEYVLFNKDGENVNLGKFDPEDKRVSVGTVFDNVCDTQGECAIDIAAVLLHPEEYRDAFEITAYHDSLEYFLRNLFPALDIGVDKNGEATGLSGNGEVDRQEVSHRVYGTIRSWQQIDDEVWAASTDDNDDGLVSLEEFKSNLAKTNVTSDLAIATALNRFSAADKNRDGWLSESDVARYRNPLWEEGRMFRWAINAYVLELDRNEDGNLEKTEYLNQESGYFTSESRVPLSALEWEFNELDVDKSGDISLIEVNKMPQIRVTTLISMAVNALVATVDTDHDRVLSIDELASAPVAQYLRKERVPVADNDDDGTGMGPHDEF